MESKKRLKFLYYLKMIKKINGYRIFMNKKLGKGAYGIVFINSCRYIKESSLSQKFLAQSRFLINPTVYHLSNLSKFRSLPENCFNFLNQDFEIFEE